jgi:hypothetical protein
VELTAWPADSRLIVRREPLHPGAQQTFDDIDGHRFTAFLTDQPDADIAILDARHRAHARVEDRIRCARKRSLTTRMPTPTSPTSRPPLPTNPPPATQGPGPTGTSPALPARPRAHPRNRGPVKHRG